MFPYSQPRNNLRSANVIYLSTIRNDLQCVRRCEKIRDNIPRLVQIPENGACGMTLSPHFSLVIHGPERTRVHEKADLTASLTQAESETRPTIYFRSRYRSEAAQTGMDTRRATEGPASVLDSTSRSPTQHNVVDMPGSAAAVESW